MTHMILIFFMVALPHILTFSNLPQEFSLGLLNFIMINQ